MLLGHRLFIHSFIILSSRGGESGGLFDARHMKLLSQHTLKKKMIACHALCLYLVREGVKYSPEELLGEEELLL